MRRGAIAVMAALALVPAAVNAQKDAPSEGRITRVTQEQIDRVMPILQTEAAATGWDWGNRAMTKTEYTAVKNALIAAKLDAADASRTRAIKDDLGAKSVREANAALFRSNATKLSTVLTKVKPDGCGGPCTVTPPTPANKR